MIEGFLTIATLMIRNLVMYSPNMTFQILWCLEFLITLVTLKFSLLIPMYDFLVLN